MASSATCKRERQSKRARIAENTENSCEVASGSACVDEEFDGQLNDEGPDLNFGDNEDWYNSHTDMSAFHHFPDADGPVLISIDSIVSAAHCIRD